jgi:predicted  nucleic acid-binding Zn-ribbon protein
LAELTAESAAVKEHAKIQMQKAIEKIKALTVTVDDKGQEVAQLQQNEARLTEEMAALREREVGLAEEIQQLRENEVRLSSSSGEVAAALQVRVAELEQSEVSLGQQLAAVRADTQDQIQALQGTCREGCWLGCDGGR